MNQSFLQCFDMKCIFLGINIDPIKSQWQRATKCFMDQPNIALFMVSFPVFVTPMSILNFRT